MRHLEESSRNTSQKSGRQMLNQRSGCLDMLNGVWETLALWVVLLIALNVLSLLLLLLLSLLNVPPFQLSIGSWMLLWWEQKETGFGITYSQWTLGAIALIATLFTVVVRRLFEQRTRRRTRR